MQKRTKYIIFIVVITALLISIFLYFRYRVRRYAKKFIGEKEIAGNSGFVNTDFQAKMKTVGWTPGAEWCSYFAKAIWIDKHSALKDKLNKLMSGSSQQTWDNFVKDTSGKFIIDREKAKSGDLVIWQKYSGGQPTSDYRGHAGIVTRADSQKFDTVEGNTTNMVSEKEHDYSEFDINNGLRLKGFIRVK